VATLDDAAEQLLVKLEGLDSEIEESEHTLDALRERMDGTAAEVDARWSALADAVRSLVERAQEEQEGLTQYAQPALDACAAAATTMQQKGGEARSTIAAAVAGTNALGRHAQESALSLESALENGEQPALALRERARSLEDEIAQLFEGTGAFLRDEVVPALGELAADARERARDVRANLAETAVAALEAAYGDWEEHVANLEDYVANQGFLASHEHARLVVDWALSECRTACEERLSAVRELVAEASRPLDALAGAIAAAAGSLNEHGATLLDAVAAGTDGARQAQAALDSVERLLAGYSFMGA
jgi:hypothetical protein